jgi:hypothetical protein
MRSDAPKKQAVSPETEAAFSPVAVSQCSTLNEAQMVVSLLGSFGIEAKIESENYFRMFGSMMPGKGGIKVLVRQLDAEAAIEILNESPERLEPKSLDQ